MKTTIFPGSQTIKTKPELHNQVIRALNLILAGLYIVVILLLLSTPVQHGNRGMGGEMEHGGNAGMGNAANLSLPALYVLFSLLVIVHLMSLYQSLLPWHVIMGVGFGMIISATLTLGLLFFVRQYANLLQSTHPVPSLVYGSLALSFLLGIYGVYNLVRNRHPIEENEKSGSGSDFPLPVNRYKNVRIIAEGGIGMIWYAQRISDNLPVVVKVPRRDDENTGISFMQEINVWKDLDHPSIATLLSANILPVPYIEIEYLPCTLADSEKPLPISRAVRIIRSLVSALVYAHGRGVAHCDIKPSNILLTGDGVPKLTDWGLTKSGSSRWSVHGYSPRYAAPEQHQSGLECGYGTDIWQIGMLFSELLTGQATIPSGTEPVFLYRGGAEILPIIQRCLASDPSERYPSAKALLEDLELHLPS